MLLLEAKKIKAHLLNLIKSEINNITDKLHLVIVSVGDDPASKLYVKSKIKLAKKLGIEATNDKFPEDISEQELIAEVEKLNENPNITGIIVQLPLPDHLNPSKIINKIDYKKDIDGLTIENLGFLVSGEHKIIPATPLGILMLLKEYNIETEGKHCIVVGRSNLVGRPISILLSQKPYNATVTLTHSKTNNLKYFTKQADILIVAIGKPNFIDKDYIKKGAVVIDVGINRVEDSSNDRGYKVVGDVDFESVKELVKAITPVPGGVGPMTVTALMFNILKAYKLQNEKQTV